MSQLAVKLKHEDSTPISPHAQFGLISQHVVMGIY